MLYHFTVMFNPAFHAAILNKPLILLTTILFCQYVCVFITGAKPTFRRILTKFKRNEASVPGYAPSGL